MEEVLNSLILVFIGEMGDKTQLLSLVMLARYQRPGLLLFGILVATLVNHFLAALAGDWLGSMLDPSHSRLVFGIIFLLFGLWVLLPDKEGEVKAQSKFGVLLTFILVFFLAEMGDKTQLATMALAAKYSSYWLVTMGSTAGMLASNGLVILFGKKLLEQVSMGVVRRLASILFISFGVAIFLGFF